MKMKKGSKGIDIQLDASDFQNVFKEVRRTFLIVRAKVKAKVKKLACRLCQE